MILKGKIVTLRPIESEDLSFLQQLTNDPELEHLIVGWSLPVSMKDQQQWFQNFRNTDKFIRYIIETEIDGVVGLTGLRDIDWKNGSAKGGGIRLLKKEIRSKGVATDAYMTMLRYAFEELRLHRVGTGALDYNSASLRFMEKCGFKREGVVRDAVFKNGAYHDEVILGCLKSDYEKIIEETDYWNK